MTKDGSVPSWDGPMTDPIGVFNISWGYFGAMGAGNLIVKLLYR